jgi:hypothetical protein
MTSRVRADEVVGAGIGREIPAGREFQATVEPHERASREARHEGNNQDHSMSRSHEPSHRSTMPENLLLIVGAIVRVSNGLSDDGHGGNTVTVIDAAGDGIRSLLLDHVSSVDEDRG